MTTGARQARHLGGVSQLESAAHPPDASAAARWNGNGFSAIASSMSLNPPPLFDRELYLARQSRVKEESAAPLRRRIEEDLADRLSVVNRRFEQALVIAPWREAVDIATASGKIDHVHAMQPGPEAGFNPEPASLDAIISLLDLQSINGVQEHLLRTSAALKPDGLYMVALFAGETLTELRASWLAAEVEITGGASPRVAPMIGLRDLGNLLQQAGLALPVADADRFTVRYADPLALMKDVKALGFANNLIGRSRHSTSRRLLFAAAQHYASHYADADGRVRATVEIAWANAWKPHPSQPKPLKPGSATISLADVLGKKQK
jgi:hypothetical protein